MGKYPLVFYCEDISDDIEEISKKLEIIKSNKFVKEDLFELAVIANKLSAHILEQEIENENEKFDFNYCMYNNRNNYTCFNLEQVD